MGLVAQPASRINNASNEKNGTRERVMNSPQWAYSLVAKPIELRPRSPLAVFSDHPSRCLQTFARSRRCNPGNENVSLGALEVLPLRKRLHRFSPDDIVHGRGHF